MAKVETHWYWVLYMFSNKEREYNKKINYQEINGDKLIKGGLCCAALAHHCNGIMPNIYTTNIYKHIILLLFSFIFFFFFFLLYKLLRIDGDPLSHYQRYTC